MGRYSLLTTHYVLFYSLLTTHYSLLTTHYSPPTTHYSQVAVLVDSSKLVCSSPPRAGSHVDLLSLAINGQQFIRTTLTFEYYRQPTAQAETQTLTGTPTASN